jgi:hypothetical protein
MSDVSDGTYFHIADDPWSSERESLSTPELLDILRLSTVFMQERTLSDHDRDMQSREHARLYCEAQARGLADQITPAHALDISPTFFGSALRLLFDLGPAEPDVIPIFGFEHMLSQENYACPFCLGSVDFVSARIPSGLHPMLKCEDCGKVSNGYPAPQYTMRGQSS